ncbi:MAG TPA: hypothetical protein VK797_00750 [Tepidisphaeraceae bacterium]|jgi:hypothetical protein|nr:hypothetical protein [Tepidisphaeraceae bacterium]
MRLITSTLAGVLLLIATAGCQGRGSIPSGARLEQTGTSGLSYTAHDSGNVYLLDATDNKKVFEGHMNIGDQIIIKPSVDLIVLAGNQANHSQTLQPDHQYQIYFDPSH